MKQNPFPLPRKPRSFGEKFGREAAFFGSPERPEPRSPGRWPLVPLILLGAILVTVGILLVGGIPTITEVTAENGELYTAEVLLSHAELSAGERLWGFDAPEVERRLKEALPLLEDVKVRRRYGGEVSIEVSEITELYYTQHHVNYYIFDAESHEVLSVMSTPDEARRVGAVYIGLPETARVRVGEEVSFINLPYEPEHAETELNTYEVETKEPEEENAYVFEFVEALQVSPLADRVLGMDLSDRYALTVVLEGGIQIRVGDMSELERKFTMADRAIADKLAKDPPPADMPTSVDVADPARIVYRVSPDIILPDWAQWPTQS